MCFIICIFFPWRNNSVKSFFFFFVVKTLRYRIKGVHWNKRCWVLFIYLLPLTVSNIKQCQHKTLTKSRFSDQCHTATNNDRLKGKYSTSGCEDLPFKRYSSRSVALPLTHLQPDAFRRALQFFSYSSHIFSRTEHVLLQIFGSCVVVLVQHCSSRNAATPSGLPR